MEERDNEVFTRGVLDKSQKAKAVRRRPGGTAHPPLPPLQVENLRFDLRDPVVVALKFPYVGDRLRDYSLDVTFQAPYAESRL